MRPSHHQDGFHPAAQHSRRVFERIARCIGRLAKSAKAEDVHRFRTNSRRLEVLISELSPDTRNRKKLLKLLSKLRKKAGKVRDLDIQIALLKDLKLPDRHAHKAQLTEWLAEQQARRARKLAKALDEETARELRKRVRRVQSELNLDGADPLRLAFARLPKLDAAPMSEKTLHSYRIAAKRARYLAELSDSPEAKLFVEEIRRAQDAIGEWHDVLQLKERAEKLFGGVHQSPLVAVLQNTGRAKQKRAVTTLLSALSRVSELQRTHAAEIPPRKPATTEIPRHSAAA
ncbi:MAG TPA: CHAD domain-containing protein [Terriglobales bacterium]|nr:CHAD domain-containing protein [Terriglobales bacterium]